jgi:signal transduction histidine kinase
MRRSYGRHGRASSAAARNVGPPPGRLGRALRPSRGGAASAARRTTARRLPGTVGSVRSRISTALAAVPTIDAALAIVVGVLGQVEVWAGVVSGPPGIAAALALLGAVPLGWRRRWPAAAALAPAAALAAGAVAGVGNESLALLVAAVVGMYSVAAFRGAREATTVLVAGGACAATSVLAGVGHVEDLLFAGFVVGAPWAAGRLARNLGLHAREAERRARQHEEQAREAAAAERARIARELHDIVAHSVSVMVAQAGGAEEIVESAPERARDAMRTVRLTGQQALVEMRRMVGLLRTGDEAVGVRPQPSLAELETLVARAREAGLEVDVGIDGAPRPLDPGVDLSAYRIIQEALTNARKHGGAGTAAQVTVRWLPTAVELSIESDGASGGSAEGGGHGLVGMHERVALYGGTLDAGPRPGGGFLVRVQLPAEACER